MGKERFREILENEIGRIDNLHLTKRNERVIEDFESKESHSPHAIIGGKSYAIFNSNDYLGLRFHPALIDAEENASRRFGVGPGAVRFISGTHRIHQKLEAQTAKFHGREDAMAFSSAFSVNLAVLHCLIRGQSKDSLLAGETLVVSDELNHRSIIDGIRVSGTAHKAIFKHLNLDDLRKVLTDNAGKFSRALIVTDGVFSMLGEHQDIGKMQRLCHEFDSEYEQGVISIVDDAHGVGAYGANGRGTEEISRGACDLLIGTYGKGFGVDGGYVTGEKVYIDYLRESAATYIYSNPVPPGTAAASLEALKQVDSFDGKGMIKKLGENIVHFKKGLLNLGLTFAADSRHAIQPVLIGDTAKTRALVDELFAQGVLVTNISYPVVPKGRDEIRVQLSAAHSKTDVNEFLDKLGKAAKKIGIIE